MDARGGEGVGEEGERETCSVARDLWFALALVTPICFGATSCGEEALSHTFNNPGHGFSISVPDVWAKAPPKALEAANQAARAQLELRASRAAKVRGRWLRLVIMPVGAATGHVEHVGDLFREDALHLSRCTEQTLRFKSNPDIGARVCGVCIRVCPFGRKNCLDG